MAENILYQNFVLPILQNGWYNPLNTLVYGILLIVGVFIVYELLKVLAVDIDRHFFYAILPFIFWGSTTRVLHDAAFAGKLATDFLNNFYNSPIFPTPGSYLITFGLALIVLVVALVIQGFTQWNYYKVMYVIGVILCGINIYLLPPLLITPLLIVLDFWLLWTAVFWLLGRRSPLAFKIPSLTKLLSNQNMLILSAHFFDAAATFASLSFFGYSEQHVVPNIFIPMFGPGVMFFLKAVVVLPVLWLIDRHGEPGSFNNLLKIVVLILGLAPGIRDTVRLMAMV
jgi:uncharacterized membrane protein